MFGNGRATASVAYLHKLRAAVLKSSLGYRGTNVCFWHKADISIALTNVRFCG
jgi:hypothetical protein